MFGNSTPAKSWVIPACPNNGHSYKSVATKTILHRLSKPWAHEIDADQRFYFCDDVICPVVYFSDYGDTLTESDLRVPILAKRGDRVTPNSATALASPIETMQTTTA
jgi:hypothetical protein